MITTCKALPGISDHDILFITSLLSVEINLPAKRKIYSWSKAKDEDIQNKASELCNQFTKLPINTLSINDLWQNFKNICIRCLEMVPAKNISTNYKHPWINRTIKRLSRRKQRYFKRAKQTNSPEHWLEYHKIKVECRRECQNTYNKYITILVSSTDKTVNKRLWTYIKSQKKDYCGVASLKLENITLTQPQAKAEALNNYFSSVFITEDTTLPVLDKSPYPDMPKIYIHDEGILNLLMNLKQHKASGPDGIPSRLLKLIAHQITPVLKIIFQISLDKSCLPEDWKCANVVPVFKKKDHSSPTNYRPVSLTSICCKVLEHIIYSNISLHLKNHNILCDEQHGFRAKRSCETQLISTIHELAKNIDAGIQTDAILLDLTKAFDRVPHMRLCNKLSYYGINDNTLKWIKNFMHGRTQQVIVEGYHSSPINVTSGVPQGTVLAPLLFLCYINDLPANINSSIKLYADDVLIYRPIRLPDDIKSLQEDLNTIGPSVKADLVIYSYVLGIFM